MVKHQEKTTDLPQVVDKLYHVEKTTDLPQVDDKLYQVNLSVANLPTDGNRTHNYATIDNDCTSKRKSNYQKIMAMINPQRLNDLDVA
jgi:hypothetical protein